MGHASQDWVVSNYVDRDPSSGEADYCGEALTYDGHRGTDISVPSMRWVDLEIPVVAAAGGVVIGVEDGHFDRNVDRESEARANVVTIAHDGGEYVTRYGHLKNGSIPVQVGDRVETGHRLGVVASSGRSAAPHLHFQVERDGEVVDPFSPWLFSACSAPSYARPFAYADTSIAVGPIHPIDVVAPPSVDQRSFSTSDTIGIGLVSAGGDRTMSLVSRVYDGAGELVQQRTVGIGDGRSTWAGRSRRVHNAPASGTPGVWAIEVHADGLLVDRKEVYVTE